MLANHRYGTPAQWSERQHAAVERWRARLSSHAGFYREFGLEVPKALQLYDSLGRFRDALLAHEIATARDEPVRTRIGQIMSRFSACLTQAAP